VRPVDPLLPIIIGVIAMVIFVWRQLMLQKKEAALLDLRTLKSKNFVISLTMITILFLSMFGTFVLLPIYLADIQHFDTWQIGLLLMPGALLMGLLGPYVGRLFDKVGPSPLIIPAIFVISAVLWAMTLLGTDTWWPLILVGHLVMSVGFAFMFGPLFTASLGSINPQLYSHGSALLGSINQVGGAAGIALFVAIMSAQQSALKAAGTIEIEALASGIRMAFTVGAAISLLAVVAAFFVRRPPVQEGSWGGGH
jgi:DHA2 family lincomycin resistance protein-like MFS transporter